MTSRTPLSLVAVLVVGLPALALAGPPLLCFPMSIEASASLPWGTGGWKAPRADYDRARLVDDTVARLAPATPTLIRMETLRRATIYAADDAALSAHLGVAVKDGLAGTSRVFNHAWEKSETFATIGTIPASEIAELSGGRLAQDVPVSLNRLIFDYDHIVICGPVFPHEVVGFSGGNKYYFPGIAGAEVINFTHWLGALITNYEVIGSGYTPVRAVIDRAASMVTVPTSCFTLVVTKDGTAGLWFGDARDAWREASALSSQRHIVWLDRPMKTVLSVMPAMYADVWTAGKGMYKIEPAVADGGEVIIYAPHIREVSVTHGRVIEEVGYHTRDYFTAQPERFAQYPGGVLAHSTHVKGMGTYDQATGIERPRVTVTLATGISEERCRRINLGYRDPASIDIAAWQGREDEGILVVPRTGEMLYRVKPR